jgi:acyl-CoA synthetase
MLDQLEADGVTVTFLVPTHLVDLMSAYDRHPGRWRLALRHVITGAAPAAQELFHRVVASWGATPISMYGMTECQGNLFTRADDPIEVIAATVGRACPGSEVALLDPATGELVRTDGAIGEIVTRGPTTFVGYYDDQAATSAAFTRDGWFRSGDLGTWSAGSVAMVGRLKEVIIRGGHTVLPQDVEAALASFPGLDQVVVLGMPDERLGERICVCVEASPDVPSVEDLRAHLAASGFSRSFFPDEVRTVAALPRTELGKVQRSKVREQLSSEWP